MSAAAAVARRALADSRTRNMAFAALFALVAAAQPIAYRRTYPTLPDRMAFAESFGANKSVMLFYGAPHDLLTAQGYAAWRVGGILSIFAAVWGVFAAVRALRAEEDAGRQELVLAGVISRRAAYLAALSAVAAGAALLWAAAFAGLALAGLPVAGSAFLALVTVSPAPVLAAATAVACQLASTRRLASAMGMAVAAVALVLRVVADTSRFGGLRWATPLGWCEQMRAFAGPRPALLVLPALATAVPLAVAGFALARRDIGRGLISGRDTGAPRRALLGSATAQAARAETGLLAAWVLGIGAFATVMGVVSSAISAAGLSDRLREQLAKFGGLQIATPRGYLSLVFLFFVLAVSLFCCAQVAAARHEEAEQRLETLLALPLGRARWLGGRLVLAAAGAAVLGLVAGALAWAGAASQGADVGLAGMLAAGVNCLPAAALFLGVGSLAVAVAPRAGVATAYGAVIACFVWELFGALLGAPAWALRLSPFHHIAFVPAQAFRPVAALVMAGVGVAAAVAALAAFRRRDLVGP